MPEKATQAPSNQTGNRDWIDRAIWTERMLAALDNGVFGNKWFSLIDKVYRPQTLAAAWQQVKANQGAAGMVYDGRCHESLARYPALAERSFIVSSFGKTYHVTGWKIAYCLAPQELMAEFRKAHQFVTFCINTPCQLGLADFMNTQPGWYDALGRFYQQKRDFFRDLIAATRFELLPCHGTYFQCVRYSAISDEPDRQLAERLTREIGVASIPVSVFYSDGEDNKVLRLCFAKNEDTLTRAAERLSKL